MKTQDLDLKTILDIPMFEHLQDALAKATGTAIITIDYKGTPVTKHSCRTEFCSVIRDNPVSRKRCTKCDALAGLEAVRLNRPYICLCHCGIVDVAVPVMVGEKYLGAVMFGQVRIPNGDTDAKVERLVSEISSFQAEEETSRRDLLEKYEKIPEMEYKRIVEIAELIDAAVCNLYGDWNGISDYATDLLDKILSCGDLKALFLELSEDEASAKEAIIEVEKKYPGVVKESNVDDVIAAAMKKKRDRDER